MRNFCCLQIVDQRLNQLEAGLSSSSSSSSSSLSSSSSSKVGGSSTFPSVAEAQQADAAFVQSLLDLHEKYKGIVEECFSVTSQSFSSSSSASSSASTSCCSLLYLPTQQQKLFKPCEPSTGGRGQGGSPDPLFQKSLKEGEAPNPQLPRTPPRGCCQSLLRLSPGTSFQWCRRVDKEGREKLRGASCLFR